MAERQPSREHGRGSLSRYLEEVSRIPLLTREREVEVSSALTEARELLLREYARIPEAVEEICCWARMAERGDVCFDRYFDYHDAAILGRPNRAAFGALVGRIERDVRRLVRLKRGRLTRRRRLAERAIEERIADTVLALFPTEPIIAKAEERVRAIRGRAMPAAKGNGNGHRHRGNGNGYARGGNGDLAVVDKRNGNGRGGNGHGARAAGSRPPNICAEDDGSLETALRRIALARHRFEECRRILTESNLRLAIAVAKPYRNRGVPLGDLIQEGNLGLIRACDRFDSRRGYRFSTYAVYWIRQSINRALPEHARTVRVPPHLTEVLARYLESRARLTGTLGREPSREEIAEVLGVGMDKVERAQKLPLEALSIDRSVSDDRGSPRPWDLPDTHSPSPLLGVQRRGLAEAAHDISEVLSPREAEVLGMRFGLCGRQEMTLEEIGRRFSVTRERVRQIQAEALKKLRESPFTVVGSYARAPRGHP